MPELPPNSPEKLSKMKSKMIALAAEYQRLKRNTRTRCLIRIGGALIAGNRPGWGWNDAFPLEAANLLCQLVGLVGPDRVIKHLRSVVAEAVARSAASQPVEIFPAAEAD